MFVNRVSQRMWKMRDEGKEVCGSVCCVWEWVRALKLSSDESVDSQSSGGHEVLCASTEPLPTFACLNIDVHSSLFHYRRIAWLCQSWYASVCVYLGPIECCFFYLFTVYYLVFCLHFCVVYCRCVGWYIMWYPFLRSLYLASMATDITHVQESEIRYVYL